MKTARAATLAAAAKRCKATTTLFVKEIIEQVG